jgi:DNA-binding transcriptional LysR family regulator
MQSFEDLFYFVQVVDHRGFAPAARALGVQKSKLSRRVATLEDRLGVRLINRSTRAFSVTEIGQRYYEQCLAALVQMEAVDAVIEQARSEPQGVVRISCPTDLLNFRVNPMLARFLAANPLVEIHLESTNRRVDVLAENFDIALRARTPPLEESDLVMRVLEEGKQRLVASPRLLKGHASIAVPADLDAFPSLDIGNPRGNHSWCVEGPNGATALIHHAPRLVTGDMATLREVALQGIGIVQLPTMVVWQDIQHGTLVDVLPEWAPRSVIIHAVFPSRRGLLPSVRALINSLAADFAAQTQHEARSTILPRNG